MSSITLDKLNSNFTNYFINTINIDEELLVTSEFGNLVIINENQWNKMNETLMLLSDKISLKALLVSHQERESGLGSKSYSIEEVFSDLQN